MRERLVDLQKSCKASNSLGQRRKSSYKVYLIKPANHLLKPSPIRIFLFPRLYFMNSFECLLFLDRCSVPCVHLHKCPL
uniref:Ovule protein n=1 Tax=Ascaris lumbricoides TaxID=6252 RepID=A0A9J2Q9E6_ASCLU